MNCDISFSDICLCELCNCKKRLLQKKNVELKNELTLIQKKYKLLEKKYNRYNNCLSMHCFCDVCPGSKCELCDNDITLVCEFCGNNYCEDYEECKEHICHKQNGENKVSTNKIEDYLPSEDIHFGCSYKYCENDHSKDTYYLPNGEFNKNQNELLDKFDWEYCKVCDAYYLQYNQLLRLINKNNKCIIYSNINFDKETQNKILNIICKKGYIKMLDYFIKEKNFNILQQHLQRAIHYKRKNIVKYVKPILEEQENM